MPYPRITVLFLTLAVMFAPEAAWADRVLSLGSFTDKALHQKFFHKTQVGTELLYSIEFGLWRNKADAELAFQTMQKNHPSLQGYKPLITELNLANAGQGIVYRLRAGFMNSQQEAERICSNMKQDGFTKKCDIVFNPR